MAIKKTCPHCKKESWSAGAVPWICPYCGKAIEDAMEVKEADNGE